MVRFLILFLAIATLASGVGGVAAAATAVRDDGCACVAASDGCDTGKMSGFSCQRCCIVALTAMPALAVSHRSIAVTPDSASSVLVSLVSGLDPPPPRG